jgi:N-methylhydantoinase A/oxoprolinase/acetone carboxylase beta subunit
MRFAVDTGGPSTDLIVRDAGSLHMFKSLITLADANSGD